MYLKYLEITDFRKFKKLEDKQYGVRIEFNPNFNVLIGENDSGKSAIIDAIKLLLGTVSNDYIRIDESDFYQRNSKELSDEFSIVAIFKDLSDKEAGSFLEWISIDESGNYELRLILTASKNKNDQGYEYIKKSLKAGNKNDERDLSWEARSILRTTYLKPLRDAETELMPGIRSRLSQILKAHPAIESKSEDLESILSEANTKIEDIFSQEYIDDHSLKKDLEAILKSFFDELDISKSGIQFSASPAKLVSILRRLSIETEEVNLGLGNSNLLFIATELLLLEDFTEPENNIGPHITLIEELEAHLHMQAQIRVIKYLENHLLNMNSSPAQFIITTHSSNIVTSINPKHIIYLENNYAHSMNELNTDLENDDYKFLERFFDATKTNMFFAKGLILVEGYAEALLLPAIAEVIDIPLYKYGVSIVNVGGTAFERYVKLFSRVKPEEGKINLPISLITDSDIKPYDKETSRFCTDNEIDRAFADKELALKEKYNEYNANLEIYIARKWTLEYNLLFTPLRDLLIESAYEAQYPTTFNSYQKHIDAKNDYIKRFSDEEENIEYRFFNEFFIDKKVSKSIVAQILAMKILKECEKESDRTWLKEELLDCDDMSYLVNAIKHASAEEV